MKPLDKLKRARNVAPETVPYLSGASRVETRNNVDNALPPGDPSNSERISKGVDLLESFVLHLRRSLQS